VCAPRHPASRPSADRAPQIGLWPYCAFLAELARADPDVGIVLLEFMPISMRLTAPPLAREALCATLATVLRAHGMHAAFVLAGHSFGTVVATYVLRSPLLARRVASAVLVDPIPFLLSAPDVAHNFVYRAPREANEWQLWYFASRDPDIARCATTPCSRSAGVCALTRAQDARASLLLVREHHVQARCVPAICSARACAHARRAAELAGKRTTVVLSGADQIVHAAEVHRYLTGTDAPAPRWAEDGLEVLFFPGLDHSVLFDRAVPRKALVNVVRAHCERKGEGAGDAEDE
jgi:pimeloyl-ACP methyl ester carboxylesterase